MCHLIALISIVLLVGWLGSPQVVAQEPTGWSPQQRVPGYDSLANSPFLIADQNRTVHAFNSVWLEDQKVIMYSQWSLDQGWTEPIDVLLPPWKSEARLKGALLDQEGTVHLVFFSGDDLAANIYYSRAPLADAGNGHAWSTPAEIGDQARTPDEAAMVGDGHGRFYVLYSSNQEGTGLYFTYSTDGGNSWSEPTLTFSTYEFFPYFLRMYMDKQGGVHALWNANNSSGVSKAFYYARLEADGLGWTEPIQFEPAGINEPSMIEYENQLLIVYHVGTPPARHMRRSFDGGRTWTEPVRLFPYEGSNGSPSLVVDSSNVLHLFFGNRLTQDKQQTLLGMWHSVWQGNSWTFPEPVVSGVGIKDEIGGEGFDPSFAEAVVSQGNVILLTWNTDPQAGKNGVWYSYKTLESPELPVVAFPSPTPSPTAIVAASATATPSTVLTPTPALKPVAIDQRKDMPLDSFTSHPAAPLIAGVFSVILVILAVVLVRRSR